MDMDTEHAWVTAAPIVVNRCVVCEHHEIKRNRLWCRHWRDWVPTEAIKTGCESFVDENIPF